VPAVAHGTGDALTVRLHEPVRGMAPGQAVVLYADDPDDPAAGERVLGGGRVVSAA
jgi:tRNA-specific 2-thiouridylase